MKCKLFAVPWEALKASRGAYILKVEKEAFETTESPGENLSIDQLSKVKTPYIKK
ncbi:MAG: hypothetical protein QM426_07280 [Euryarchaeota archaeon]|nr:hypothetical protein [Euryarchaeota archaeon]